MNEKVTKVKMIAVPGRKEPAPEMWGGRIADYYCPACEPVPPEKKGHVPVGFQHDSCLLPKLA